MASLECARPRSHLESSFIEGLRKRYPKACNRSLTNLTELGLSYPESSHHDNSAVSSNPSGLSAWSKGLSSSQPDLLKTTNLNFYPHNVGIDIDAPPTQHSALGSRTMSTSGLHLLQQQGFSRRNDQSSDKKPGLSTALIHERLRESRLKMNEIASKITLISRSNTDLSSIDQSPLPLSLSSHASRISHASEMNYNDTCDSDEVDDSAPTCSTSKPKNTAAARCSLSLSNRTSPIKENRTSLSSSEAKIKLEELRIRLTQKCESLQKRREEIFNRIKSSSAHPVSSDQSQTEKQTTHISAIAGGANGSTPTHRKSGTDSDGDSGIDLSLKWSKLEIKNSLVPKLRRYPPSSSLAPLSTINNNNSVSLPPTVSQNQSECFNNATDQPNHRQQSKFVSKATSESDSESLRVQHPPANRITRISSQSILKGSNVNLLSKTTESTKSVRFTQRDDVIASETPKLVELKELAEESVSSAKELTFLPDTALEGFDSDSESSISDSDCSSTDLTDIDPRISQLALGSRRPSQKLCKQHPSNANNTESQHPHDHHTTIPNTGSEQDDITAPSSSASMLAAGCQSLITSPSSCSESHNDSEPAKTPSSKKNSPPKPPRLSHLVSPKVDTVYDTPFLTSHRVSADVVLEENRESVNSVDEGDGAHPYSVVDTSAFKKPSDDFSSKTKRKGRSKKSSHSKPPLPKSTPPKKSTEKHQNKLTNSAQGESQPESSRRSRLDKKDFEPPYSYSDSRPAVSDRRTDSDWESVDGDVATPNQTLQRSPNSTLSSGYSKAPPERSRRGRTGSSGDLWGSNASLYSSSEKLGSSDSLSGSRSSLFERVGSFKQAAKKKMKSLKRSLSLDRLGSSKSTSFNPDLPPPAPLSKHSHKAKESSKNGVPAIKKSLSWRSLNQLKFSKKANSGVDSSPGGAIADPESKGMSPKKGSTIASTSVESPNHFRAIGKLLELCADGSRKVQLNRPPHGPYGFYIGESPHKAGFFVTRLSDSYAEKLFSGLLCVGDEIKEINGTKVSKISQNGIMDIISKSKKLILKVKTDSALRAEEWF